MKSETIDVQESGEPKSLRPIDPQRDLIDAGGRRPPGPSSSTTTGRLTVAATRDTNWRR